MHAHRRRISARVVTIVRGVPSALSGQESVGAQINGLPREGLEPTRPAPRNAGGVKGVGHQDARWLQLSTGGLMKAIPFQEVNAVGMVIQPCLHDEQLERPLLQALLDEAADQVSQHCFT